MNTLARVYCRECGANLADPSAAPLVRSRAAERVRICGRCRRGNPADAEVCVDCGGRLMESVARPGTEQRVMREIVPAPDPLPCPGCGTEMESGVAFLNQGTFWQQMLTDRRGWIPLVFRRNESARLERVVRPGEEVHAQRCPACNSVWIAPPPPRETGW